jgi:glutathione S-transferase
VAVTLYQAEWCPFSSAVRELLTELGIDVLLHQVEPYPEERAQLREIAATDEIPVLQSEDGRIFRGTRDIFAYLATREPGAFAAAHRDRFKEHRDARESGATERLLGHFPAP